MVEQKKGKRGRPKKTIQDKKDSVVVKEEVVEKIKKVEEVVVANKAKIRALIRLTHKSVTYEPGQVFEEEDPKMVEQIINNKFGEIV